MNHLEVKIDLKPSPISFGNKLKQPFSESRAYGKSILIGEHAVVYGAEAIAFPLHDCGISLRLEILDKNSPNIVLLGSRGFEKEVESVVLEAFEILGLKKLAFKISGKSSLPIGAGLGSSAVVCISILRAIANLFNTKMSSQRLSTLGNKLEERFHGTPSGLDAAVVAFERPVSFRRNRPLEILDLDRNCEQKNMKLLLIDSGLRAATKEMVKLAEPYFRGIRGNVRLQRFDALSAMTKHALKTSDHAELAEAMNECNRKLTDASVVPPKLQEIINACMDLGAIAGKVTGAGGGGCVQILLEPGTAKETIEAIEQGFPSLKKIRVDI